jgi:hypothetical protein
MAMLVRVIGSLSPGWWRVVVGPGVGMMDGGSEQDWPESWVPPAARRPNGEFRIAGWVDGVPRVEGRDR